MRTAVAFAVAVALGIAVSVVAHAQAPSPPPAAPEPAAVEAEKPARGFIDDAFAWSPDGSELAWLVTDGVSFAELHRKKLGAPERVQPCTCVAAESLEFLDGERLLVVERDQQTGLARGQVLGPLPGPKKGAGVLLRLGPASHIALTTVGGAPAIVTHLRTPSGAGARHTVAAIGVTTLKPLARRELVEAAGTITVGPIALRETRFTDGWTTLVGLHAGGFSRQHDVQAPDRVARVSLFAARILDEADAGDRVERARLEELLHRKEPASRSVQASADLHQVLLVDEKGATPLQLPRPLGRYDLTTLAWQPASLSSLWVSLTVDPVNAEAVRAKKADVDYLDLYALDLSSRALTPLLRLDGKRHPTRWRMAPDGHHAAVLRKGIGFPRGGTALEVYTVAP